MNEEIQAYNDRQTKVDKEICHLLATIIDSELTEAESRLVFDILEWGCVLKKKN